METATIENTENKINHTKAAIPLLWVAIVAMVMIFASLTSGYVVSRGKQGWLHFELPQLFYVSTALLLLSSVTMNMTLSAAKKNDLKSIKIASLITLILGIGFVYCQFKAWGQLVDQNVYFTGTSSSVSGSYLYILTGLHLAHLAFGIGALLVVWVKSVYEKYSAENLLGIRLCAIFWHFLDFLWIFLFLFLLFVR